jgi:Flp pilus assembly protein TadG
LRTHKLRFLNESGQASVEFALVLPLLLFVLFAIIEFSRAFNAYNDLNQMAASGARFASVGRYPGDAGLKSGAADTAVSQAATITLKYDQNGVLSDTCVVGAGVVVTTTSPVQLAPILNVGSINLKGHAEMRVERCPS